MALAVAIRLAGLTTRSFWYDESATAALSEGSLGRILAGSSADTTPPFYFVATWLWRMAAGDGDGAIRLHGVAWSLAGLWLLHGFARDALGRRAALWALAFGALNPLSAEFAREARMYATASALATAAAWTLWRWMKRPTAGAMACYVAATWAMLMTHYAAGAVAVAHGLVMLVALGATRHWRMAGAYVGAAATVVLLLSPWLLYVALARGGFDMALVSWIPRPVAWDMVEWTWLETFWGRPSSAHEWGWTLSGPILAAAALAGLSAALRRVGRDLSWPTGTTRSPRPTTPHALSILVAWAFLPPWLAWGMGAIFQPIFFRPRFAMFCLPVVLMLLGAAVASVPRLFWRRALGAAIASVMALGLVQKPAGVAPADWRVAATVWRRLPEPAAVVFFPPHESVTLSRQLSEPIASMPFAELAGAMPSLRGRIVRIVENFDFDMSRKTEPQAYRRLLASLGRTRPVLLDRQLVATDVMIEGPTVPAAFAGRFQEWYPPFDVQGRIEGFSNSKLFDTEEQDPAGQPFRWSRPTAWISFPDTLGAAWGGPPTTVTLAFDLPPAVVPGWKPDLELAIVSVSSKDRRAAATLSDDRPGPRELSLPWPAGGGPVMLAWRLNGVNLAKAGHGADDRDLGLRIHWVGLARDGSTTPARGMRRP